MHRSRSRGVPARSTAARPIRTEQHGRADDVVGSVGPTPTCAIPAAGSPPAARTRPMTTPVQRQRHACRRPCQDGSRAHRAPCESRSRACGSTTMYAVRRRSRSPRAAGRRCRDCQTPTRRSAAGSAERRIVSSVLRLHDRRLGFSDARSVRMSGRKPLTLASIARQWSSAACIALSGHIDDGAAVRRGRDISCRGGRQ